MERRVVDVAAEVEKFAREASKKFGILDDRLENAGGGESLSHMIFHLGEASFDFEACVPSATVGPVEAAWLSRFCVGEGGVEVGRASCREGGCKYVEVSGVAGALKKKDKRGI